jgi:hypothetical protein
MAALDILREFLDQSETSSVKENINVSFERQQFQDDESCYPNVTAKSLKTLQAVPFFPPSF